MERLTIGKVFREELGLMLKDKKLIIILLITPILYSVLFGFLYSHERITEIPIVVYDGDNSQLSRQIIQAFDATDTFAVTKQSWNQDDIVQQVEEGQFKVGLIIPNDFSASLKHGENVPILTVIDGSNLMYSNSASRIANQVISSVSAGASMKALEQKGMNSDQANSVFSTIPFRSRVLYNPVYNYKLFMPIGVISTALQQCLLLGIALSCTRDKELGTWSRFYHWRHTAWRLAIAKLTPYFLAGMVNVITVFSIAAFAFHIPFKGQLLPFLLIAIAFNLALCGLGFLFSLFSRTKVDATQTLMLIAVPSFMLSGYTWPLEAMPTFLQMVAKALPLTYYLDAVRAITLKGQGMSAIVQDILALSLIGLISLLIALIAYPLAFKKSEQQAGEVIQVEQTTVESKY